MWMSWSLLIAVQTSCNWVVPWAILMSTKLNRNRSVCIELNRNRSVCCVSDQKKFRNWQHSQYQLAAWFPNIATGYDVTINFYIPRQTSGLLFILLFNGVSTLPFLNSGSTLTMINQPLMIFIAKNHSPSLPAELSTIKHSWAWINPCIVSHQWITLLLLVVLAAEATAKNGSIVKNAMNINEYQWTQWTTSRYGYNLHNGKFIQQTWVMQQTGFLQIRLIPITVSCVVHYATVSYWVTTLVWLLWTHPRTKQYELIYDNVSIASGHYWILKRCVADIESCRGASSAISTLLVSELQHVPGIMGWELKGWKPLWLCWLNEGWRVFCFVLQTFESNSCW